jgi:predicted SprT family Zn-dependent metalloprotease
VTVVLNPRLRTTVARYLPRGKRLEVSTTAARARHPERVLVHELAHAAAVRLHGPGVKPHGKEWAALVEAAERAGLTTRTRRLTVTKPKAPKANPTTARFAHTCPVCQVRRIAKRRVTTWRCPDCHANGLPGDLVIERLR